MRTRTQGPYSVRDKGSGPYKLLLEKNISGVEKCRCVNFSALLKNNLI